MSTATDDRKPITVSIVSHGQLALIQPLLEQLDCHCHGVPGNRDPQPRLR